MKRRTIAVVTTSRADYSHLYWVLKDLEAHPQVDLKVIVLAAHLSPEFGATVSEIERDGLPIASRIECLLSSDSDVGMAKTLGLAVLGLTDALAQMRPDLLLLIADRYEMLAPASVALTLRIPVAHIEGGEISEGAIDDAVRNALTKMAHIPWEKSRGVSNAPAHRRSTIFAAVRSSRALNLGRLLSFRWRITSPSLRITLSPSSRTQQPKRMRSSRRLKISLARSSFAIRTPTRGAMS